MSDPAHLLTAWILSMGLGLQILLLVAAVAFGIFWWGLHLWNAGRLTGIEKATFGGAMRTSLFVSLCVAALVGGVILVFCFEGRHWITAVALAVALVAYPIIVVGFIKSGMETTVGRALGAWAASFGLRAMITLAAMVVLMPVMWLVVSPHRDAPAPTVAAVQPTPVPGTPAPALPVAAVPAKTAAAPAAKTPAKGTAVAAKSATKAGTTVVAKAGARRGTESLTERFSFSPSPLEGEGRVRGVLRSASGHRCSAPGVFTGG